MTIDNYSRRYGTKQPKYDRCCIEISSYPNCVSQCQNANGFGHDAAFCEAHAKDQFSDDHIKKCFRRELGSDWEFVMKSLYFCERHSPSMGGEKEMKDEEKIISLIAKAECETATINERVGAVKKAASLLLDLKNKIPETDMVNDYISFRINVSLFYHELIGQKNFIERKKSSIISIDTYQNMKLFHGLQASGLLIDSFIKTYEKTFPHVRISKNG